MHEGRLVHFLYETAGRLRTDAENFCARAMTKLESYCMRRRILLAEVPKVFYKKKSEGYAKVCISFASSEIALAIILAIVHH